MDNFTAEQVEQTAEYLMHSTPNWYRESFGDWKGSVHTCDRAPKDATTMLRAYAERLRQDDKDAKDAARYRWLREEEDWDSAIDEAIKGGCMNTPEELEWSARNMDEMHLPNVADTYRAYAECLRELARVTAERDELRKKLWDEELLAREFHDRYSAELTALNKMRVERDAWRKLVRDYNATHGYIDPIEIPPELEQSP